MWPVVYRLWGPTADETRDVWKYVMALLKWGQKEKGPMSDLGQQEAGCNPTYIYAYYYM